MDISQSSTQTSICTQVTFIDVPDVMLSADIKCQFNVSQTMNIGKGDRIGLFVVGWSDVKDCKSFVLVPQLTDDSQINVQSVSFEGILCG